MNALKSLACGCFKQQGLAISSGTRPFIFYLCAFGEGKCCSGHCVMDEHLTNLLYIWIRIPYPYVCVLFKTGCLCWKGRGNVCPPILPLTFTNEEGLWTLNNYTHLMVVSHLGFLLLMPVILILRNPASIDSFCFIRIICEVFTVSFFQWFTRFLLRH